eukprot:5061915-Pyramimonas_sp.AAC.1
MPAGGGGELARGTARAAGAAVRGRGAVAQLTRERQTRARETAPAPLKGGPRGAARVVPRRGLRAREEPLAAH